MYLSSYFFRRDSILENEKIGKTHILLESVRERLVKAIEEGSKRLSKSLKGSKLQTPNTAWCKPFLSSCHGQSALRVCQSDKLSVICCCLSRLWTHLLSWPFLWPMKNSTPSSRTNCWTFLREFLFWSSKNRWDTRYRGDSEKLRCALSFLPSLTEGIARVLIK